MWLFTQHGCFSVVVDGEDRTHVLVRARNQRHLENLKEKFDYVEDHEVLVTPARDYPYHIRVKRSRWLILAQDLAGDIKYTSFRTAAGKSISRVGPRYVQVLQKVWQLLCDEYEAERPRVSREK